MNQDDIVLKFIDVPLWENDIEVEVGFVDGALGAL